MGFWSILQIMILLFAGIFGGIAVYRWWEASGQLAQVFGQMTGIMSGVMSMFIMMIMMMMIILPMTAFFRLFRVVF